MEKLRQTRISILLVEDNDDDVKLFQVALRSLPKIVITHAPTLQMAINELVKRPGEFDMIVSDLALPDCMGLDVVRRLTQLHDWILIYSGNEERETYEVIREGADSFVWKGSGFLQIRDAVICTYERSKRKHMSKN